VTYDGDDHRVAGIRRWLTIDAVSCRLADDRRLTMTGICHSRCDGEVETETDVTHC